jgi:hypothetical protein
MTDTMKGERSLDPSCPMYALASHHCCPSTALPTPHLRYETLPGLFGSLSLFHPQNLPFRKLERQGSVYPATTAANCVSKNRMWSSCALAMRSQSSTTCEEKMVWIGMTTLTFCQPLSLNSGTTIEQPQKALPWVVPCSPITRYLVR